MSWGSSPNNLNNYVSFNRVFGSATPTVPLQTTTNTEENDPDPHWNRNKIESGIVVSITTTYLMDGQYEQDTYSIYSKNYSDFLNAHWYGFPKLEYKRLQYLHSFQNFWRNRLYTPEVQQIPYLHHNHLFTLYTENIFTKSFFLESYLHSINFILYLMISAPQ